MASSFEIDSSSYSRKIYFFYILMSIDLLLNAIIPFFDYNGTEFENAQNTMKKSSQQFASLALTM